MCLWTQRSLYANSGRTDHAVRVEFTKTAEKELARIGRVASRINAKINQYAADPSSLRNNVKALKGRETYRLRIGDYRVIFEIDGDTMVVHNVRPRSGAYD